MAGVLDIDAAFGFYATLDSVSRYMGVSDNETLKMSYYEFYTKLAYISAINAYNKRLRELY